MNDILNLFNIITTSITIISATISLILWFRYRERNKWIYSSFLSILEGLNRIIIFSRLKPKKLRLYRIGDMLVTLRDNVVSSMKTIDSKRSDRLKSW